MHNYMSMFQMLYVLMHCSTVYCSAISASQRSQSNKLYSIQNKSEYCGEIRVTQSVKNDLLMTWHGLMPSAVAHFAITECDLST